MNLQEIHTAVEAQVLAGQGIVVCEALDFIDRLIDRALKAPVNLLNDHCSYQKHIHDYTLARIAYSQFKSRVDNGRWEYVKDSDSSHLNYRLMQLDHKVKQLRTQLYSKPCGSCVNCRSRGDKPWPLAVVYNNGHLRI